MKERATSFASTEKRPGAKSETEFMRFSEDNDYGNSEIAFVKDETGQVSHAVYRSDNKEVWRAKRIK